MEGTRLAVRELRWIDAFDAAILITETEAAPLREFVASRKLHIVGNGVTLPPLLDPPAAARPTVGFVGLWITFPTPTRSRGLFASAGRSFAPLIGGRFFASSDARRFEAFADWVVFPEFRSSAAWTIWPRN